MIDDPIPGLKEQLRHSILTEIGLMDHFGAAQMLGVDEARMSNLLHNRLGRFSLQRLIRLLARINRRVDISVVPVGPLPRRRINQDYWKALGVRNRIVEE